MVITAFIILTVAERAIEFLLSIDLSQLVAPGWFPRRGMFDLATLLIGTFLVTVIAMAHRGSHRPAVGDLPGRVRLASGFAGS